MADVGGDLRRVMRSKGAIIFEVAPYQGADMRSCITAALEIDPMCREVYWRSADMEPSEMYSGMQWIDGRYPHWDWAQ